MPQVPIERTPLTAQEAAECIAGAWHRRFQSAITPEVEALLLALWDLETGTGRSQFHFNFGNIIATRPDEQPFYIADDSGNTRKFRAFATCEAGADNFVGQLTRDSRAQWRDGLLSGDPTTFVKALKGHFGGPEYFEADFDRYLSTFLGRWRRYDPKATPPRRGQTSEPPTPSGRRLGSLLLLGVIVSFPLLLVRLRARRS